jgi:uncharacterized protein (DUF433 family)
MINTKTYYPTTIDMNDTERELNIKLRAYYALNDEYKNLVSHELKENNKNANPWSKLKRDMKNITSANRDYIWGTGSNDKIYKCDQPCDDKKWEEIAGSLKQVSTDDDEVWGVNSSDQIYKKNVDNSNDWTKIGGALKNVSASGSKIWGVNNNDEIYNCSKPCNGDWVKKSGSLSQVSTDNQYVWGVNANNNIYRASSDGSGNWENIPGKGKWISAEAENNLYLIGMDDKIWKCDKPCDSGEWKKMLIDGKYKQVSGNIGKENSLTAINDFNIAMKYTDTNKDKTGWTTKKGENIMSGLVANGGESTSDWKYLGTAKNISECRAKAMKDTRKNEIIYSSVVYNTSETNNASFKNTCYAGIKDGQINKVQDSKAITSYPPHGVTVLGGTRGILILNKMKLLNEEIEQLMNNYNVLTKAEINKSITYKSKTIKSNIEMKKLIKKLKKERKKIEEELTKRNNFVGKNEQASLTLVYNQYKYIGWTALAAVLIIATLSQLKKNN